MARKIDLRTGCLVAVNGNAGPVTFSWGEMMRHILRTPPRGQGFNFDEVVKVVEAITPISKALEDDAEAVTLSEDQWRILVDKVDKYEFGIADPAVVEFGYAIKRAPEIT